MAAQKVSGIFSYSCLTLKLKVALGSKWLNEVSVYTTYYFTGSGSRSVWLLFHSRCCLVYNASAITHYVPVSYLSRMECASPPFFLHQEREGCGQSLYSLHGVQLHHHPGSTWLPLSSLVLFRLRLLVPQRLRTRPQRSLRTGRAWGTIRWSGQHRDKRTVVKELIGDRRAQSQCTSLINWTMRSITPHLFTGLCVPGPGRGNPRECAAGSFTDITHWHSSALTLRPVCLHD